MEEELQERAKKGKLARMFGAGLDMIKSTMWFAMSAGFKALAVGGVIMYKIVDLIFNSPELMQGLIEIIHKIREAMCIKNAQEKGLFKMGRGDLRPTNPTEPGQMESMYNSMMGDDHLNRPPEEPFKELNLETGKWIEVPEEKKAEYAEKREDIAERTNNSRAQFLTSALKSVVGEKWGSSIETLQTYMDGTFDKLFEMLKKVPVIGKAIEAVGGKEAAVGAMFAQLTMAGGATSDAMSFITLRVGKNEQVVRGNFPPTQRKQMRREDWDPAEQWSERGQTRRIRNWVSPFK